MNITYAKGSNLSSDAAYEERATMFGRSLNRDNRTDKEMLEEALKVAANADVIVAALGESSEMSGESSSRLSPIYTCGIERNTGFSIVPHSLCGWLSRGSVGGCRIRKVRIILMPRQK